MRNNSVKISNYIEFRPMVKEEMPFKDSSYLELWQSFSSAERTHLFNSSRGYYEEYFCKIVFNLDQWFRRIQGLRYFLS